MSETKEMATLPQVLLLPLPLIEVNSKTQMRVRGLIPDWVKQMREALKESWEQAEIACTQVNANNVLDYFDAPFPPVTVFHDGVSYHLADGAHRIEAFKMEDVPVINAEIHSGGLREAILFAFSANGDAAHGEKRTDADKRKAAISAIQMGVEEGVAWSDREVARLCQVSHTYIANLRRSLEQGNTYVNPEVASDGEEVAPPVAPDRVGKGGKRVPGARISAKSNADRNMTAEDWLASLPMWRVLQSRGSHCLALMENDALTWRALQNSENLPNLQRHIGRVYDITLGAATPLEETLLALAKLPHPKEWALCSCSGDGCQKCGNSGYQLCFGRKGEVG